MDSRSDPTTCLPNFVGGTAALIDCILVALGWVLAMEKGDFMNMFKEAKGSMYSVLSSITQWLMTVISSSYVL